jgi:signal transduction histidine kinase/sensor domain CHASE-containing protein
VRIRWKIFLGLSLITVILLSVLYFVSNNIIDKGFYSVEHTNTVKSVNQAYDGVMSILTQMSVKISDWASWDDTYDYVLDHNEKYEELNLNQQALNALKVDIVIVIDSSRNIVGSYAVDSTTREGVSVPSSLLQHIQSGSPLLDYKTINESHRGFLMLPEGPLAFVANPILTNAGEGPSRGTLIFGKYFDEASKKSIEDLTHLTIKLYKYNDTSLPEEIKNIEESIPERNSIIVKPLSTNEISGYITLKDYYGKPILLLETVEPRSVFKQSQATIWYFQIFMLGSGLTLVFASVYLVNLLLVNRVSKMSSLLKVVDPVIDAKVSVQEKGRDEIGLLAQSINSMFGKIRSSSDKIRDLLEQLKIEKMGVEKTVQERTVELHDEKARIIASIDGIVGAYILFDKNGNVILVNRMVTEVLGETSGNWTMPSIQQKLGQVLDISKEFENCVKARSKFFLKSVFLGTKFLDIHMTPIFVDEGGKTKNVGVLLLIHDITEEKVLQRSKDEFFSIASHELRTPLTVIRGNMSIALKYYSSEFEKKELKDLIDDTYKSSIRLIGIVNDFLDMSRLEQGKVDFKKENFDLIKLTGSVVYELSPKAQEKNITLGFSQNSLQECTLVADEEKLKEVLINLVANAINFTEVGGVTIDISLDGEFVNIQVTDTGRGIPESLQSLLFRKFQQAGESLFTRDSYKGTGLGLYISKMLAEGMGGSIKLVKSEEGKGSTFLVQLPVA